MDDAMLAEVRALVDGNPVLVMATSTCPFCIEVRHKRVKTNHGEGVVR